MGFPLFRVLMIFHGLLFAATGAIWALPCTLIVGTTFYYRTRVLADWELESTSLSVYRSPRLAERL